MVVQEFLNDLVELAGSKSQLARYLGLSTDAVNKWFQRGKISKVGMSLIGTSNFFGFGNARPETLGQLAYQKARYNQLDYEARQAELQDRLKRAYKEVK